MFFFSYRWMISEVFKRRAATGKRSKYVNSEGGHSGISRAPRRPTKKLKL
jgi:hypothetical protein